jgi:hypothetical protein
LAVLGKKKANASEIIDTSTKIHQIFRIVNPVDEKSLEELECVGVVFNTVDKTLNIESKAIVDKLEEIHSALPEGLIRLGRGVDQ